MLPLGQAVNFEICNHFGAVQELETSVEKFGLLRFRDAEWEA